MFRVLMMVAGILGPVVTQAQAPLRADVGVWTGMVHSSAPVTPALGLTTALRWKGAVSLRLRAGFTPQLRSPVPADFPPMLRYSSEGLLTDASLLFAPILVDIVGWNGRIHLGVGMGMVRTVDDLEVDFREDDPYALVVAKQWHPTASWTAGLSGPISKHLAVSFDVSALYYVEVLPIRTEVRRPVISSLSVLLRPSRDKRPLHD
jgi:hypothetical protein